MLGPLLLAMSAPERSSSVLFHPEGGHRSSASCTHVRPDDPPSSRDGRARHRSLYALYFTPLYAATLRSEPLHELVHLHMLVTGCALTWSLVGPDPVPYRPALRLRSAALIAALAAHAVLGRLLYAHAATLATDGSSPDDWRQGAQLLFYGGDLVDLALLVCFFARWYALEGRRVARRRTTVQNA